MSNSSLPSSKDRKLDTCERQEGRRYPALIAEALLMLPRKLVAKLS